VSGHVDVLAVIDRAAGGLFAAQGRMPDDLMQARTAVEKLIADRAELFEALRNLELAVCDIRGIEMDDYCPRELEAARAAIARATGESHD